MLNFLYAEINVVGAALLLLMLYNLNSRNSNDVPFDQRLFNGIMFLNLLIFLFDTGMWLLDGKVFPLARILNYAVTTGYYILNPLICLWWLMYTDFKIFESESGLYKRIRFYVVPAVVSALLSLISVFNGWYFVIDEGNGYSRGSLFLVMLLFCFVYLMYSFFLAANDVRKNGWDENKGMYVHLLIFTPGILLAIAVQTLFFGVSIIWVCAMLACASIYINIQNGEISSDYLTGLYNRRRLDHHLQRKLKLRREDLLLFAILLDLDKFKSINDTFGHQIGDDALVQTANLLRAARKDKDDFIARMGGDEFVIIGERTVSKDIDELMSEIESKVLEFNKSGQSDYSLSLSMGYSVFGKDDTMDSFLASADLEMYRKKQERKESKNAE